MRNIVAVLLSLALGTGVVSPLDMASGYSTIADGGVYTPPTGIRFVTDKYGSEPSVVFFDNLVTVDNMVDSAMTALTDVSTRTV